MRVCVLMAAASQVSRNKRGGDEYWNGGLDLPDPKRINGGLTLAQDSDLMALLDEINNLDGNNGNPEQTDADELESEMRLIGVIESLEDEIGWKAQTENKIESADEKDSVDQMVSFKQGELTADCSNSEATSVYDIADFTYYHDVRADFGFLDVEHICPDEVAGIVIENYIDGDSMANIMYSDTVHGYAETTEDFYESLWEHDIWQLNEHPVIQKDLESPQQEKVGLVVSEAEIHDVWNDIIPIQNLSDNKEGL